MAYNSYFPASYPYYGGTPAQPVAQRQQTNSFINWVQGEAAAKSYPVAPGCSVLLMDSESNTMYIKSADASGMPMPLRIFDYKERNPEPAPAQGVDMSAYVTREELEKKLAELGKGGQA